MNQKAIRILAVDDERLVTWSLEQCLSRDFMVSISNGPEEALQDLDPENFDVLIIDPSGHAAFTSKFKKRNPAIKIIFMSDFKPANHLLDMADLYYDKPFNLERIREDIKLLVK